MERQKSTNTYQLHSVEWRSVPRWKRWIYVNGGRKQFMGGVSELGAGDWEEATGPGSTPGAVSLRRPRAAGC